MPTIEFCSARLFYQRCGVGDPVLLLHGSAATGGLWRQLVEDLDEDFSCYTPDLAGYGRSSGIGGKSSLYDEAAFIAPLLWHNTQRFHLIGHSFGGAVALAAALAWPARVKTLTLYEPTAFSVLRESDPKSRNAFETITRLSDDMQQFAAHYSEEHAMRHFVDFWNGAGAWDRMAIAQRDQLARLSSKIIKDFRVLFAETWHKKRFEQLPFPTTILRGNKSPDVIQRVAEVLADLIPCTRLITIPDVGHMAPVTDPGLIVSVIKELLSGGDTSRQDDEASKCLATTVPRKVHQGCACAETRRSSRSAYAALSSADNKNDRHWEHREMSHGHVAA